MDNMDRPLLIITFQGVLGDFIRIPVFKLREAAGKRAKEKWVQDELEEELWETWKGLNLRQGALDGLKYLSRHY